MAFAQHPVTVLGLLYLILITMHLFVPEDAMIAKSSDMVLGSFLLAMKNPHP